MNNAPRSERIAVARLTVDRDVQRALDPARVRRIVADFQPSALGVVVISRRSDGTLHVIDGQHRVAAIQVVDPERAVDCLVYEGLTLAEEAMMFRYLNSTRAVQSIDKFRVRVVEGDPVTIELNDLLIQHGWTVRAGAGQGSFAAVSEIEKLRRTSSVEVVDTTIAVLTKAWGHETAGVAAELVGGVGAVFARHGVNLNTGKLILELGKQNGGPRAFLARARGARDLYGGNVRDAVSQMVIGLMNKGRRTKLPNWLED